MTPKKPQNSGTGLQMLQMATLALPIRHAAWFGNEH